jgi:hypothetical protein
MHMPVDGALTVAAASRAVQSLLVAMESWSVSIVNFLWRAFLKMIQLLRHKVNLGGTLTLEEMIRFRRVKPF